MRLVEDIQVARGRDALRAMTCGHQLLAWRGTRRHLLTGAGTRTGGNPLLNRHPLSAATDLTFLPVLDVIFASLYVQLGLSMLDLGLVIGSYAH